MSLDILMLSILSAGPVHGYELKRRMQRPMLAPLSNNSLYPALRRFELAGAVTRHVETSEGRPSRNVFALTDHGRTMLHELIVTLPAELAGNDEEFLVRVGFFADLTAPERLGILGARDGALAAQVDQLERLIEQLTTPTPGGWRAATTRHLLDRLTRERAWVQELSQRVGDDAPHAPRTTDGH